MSLAYGRDFYSNLDLYSFLQKGSWIYKRTQFSNFTQIMSTVTIQSSLWYRLVLVQQGSAILSSPKEILCYCICDLVLSQVRRKRLHYDNCPQLKILIKGLTRKMYPVCPIQGNLQQYEELKIKSCQLGYYTHN